MPSRAKEFSLIFVSLLLAVFLGFLIYSRRGPRLVYAPAGGLVSSFPRELVLDKDAKTETSYFVNYGHGVLQSSGTLKSLKSRDELIAMYENYFRDGGWVLKNITTRPDSYGLYLVKDKRDASVLIIDRGDRREVAISYLTK